MTRFLTPPNRCGPGGRNDAGAGAKSAPRRARGRAANCHGVRNRRGLTHSLSARPRRNADLRHRATSGRRLSVGPALGRAALHDRASI